MVNDKADGCFEGTRSLMIKIYGCLPSLDPKLQDCDIASNRHVDFLRIVWYDGPLFATLVIVSAHLKVAI